MPQWGLTWLDQVQCYNQYFGLVDSEVLRNLHLRVAAIRYPQPYDDNKHMSQILNHPFYQASSQLEYDIVNQVDNNLDALTNTYVPSYNDRNLFFPYGNNYVLQNSVNYFHPQFFFDIGIKVIEKANEHESRIGKEICKEGIYAVMSMCAVAKNDILNYRIYLEKMLQQRHLYLPTPIPLIDLINNEPVFDSAKREANRVFDANSIVHKFKTGSFPEISLTNVCTSLSDFHQKQFVTYILNYRQLHYSLNNPTCPEIIFEHCYSLIQNLCVLVESHLKEKKSSQNSLWNLLQLNIKMPYKSILSTRLNLKTRFNTHDIPTFNTHLPTIIEEFETKTNQDELICYCLYVTYMCRNQVLHNITDGAIFHGDGSFTEKLIGMLISSVHFISKV